MSAIMTCFLICLAVLLGGPAVAAAERVALVIGQSDYQSLSKLANPVPDAKAIAAALREHGFQVTEHYDLPRADLLDALEEFTSTADQAQVALVYYAGHGMEIAGRNVLAPKDMEIDCEKKTPRRAIELDQIFAAVSGAPSQIVLLDACRNDPFPQCPSRSAGSGSGFRGFARVTAEGRSLLVANATLSGQLAADGDPGAHSPFASALLARFSSDPGAYLRDLLDLTAADVSKSSRGAQVPEILTRGGAPRICLDRENCGGVVSAAAKAQSTTNTAPRQSSLDQAARGWADVQSTESAAVLAAFLREFPDGFYAELARAKLENLKRIGATPPRDVEPKAAPVETAAALTPQAVQAPKTGHAAVQDCDRLAAEDNNPDSVAPGVEWNMIDETKAVPACQEAMRLYPDEPRFGFQLGRAYLQAKQPELAAQQFESLSRDGYHIATSYLGYLHADGSGVPKDATKAYRLFRQAAEAGDGLGAAALAGAYEWQIGVQQDAAEALRWYHKAAEAGVSTAILHLGDLYAEGKLGLAKDEAEAARWFRKAADRGDAKGLYSLGLLRWDGRGVPKDQAEAERLFAKGDEQRSTWAILDVGQKFRDGRGVKQDLAEAMKWFRKGADLGDQFAMIYIGLMYRYGTGVAEDDGEAIRWYRKAADAGNKLAMTTLAEMYDAGEGVPKDAAESERWRVAANGGSAPSTPSSNNGKAEDQVAAVEPRTAEGQSADSPSLLRSFGPFEHDVVSVAFAPDGNRMYALVSGGYFMKLDQASGEAGAELGLVAQRACCQMVVSPDGKYLASGNYDNLVLLWDAETGEQLRSFKGHSDYVDAVAFSPDGNRIASGSYDGTIRIWDAGSGKQVRSLDPRVSKTHSIAFSQDGKLLASGHTDGDIKVWDAASGRLLNSEKANNYGVYSLVFSPDGTRLISTGADAKVRVWDLAAKKELTNFGEGYSSLCCVAISPDGRTVAAGGTDNLVRLWDFASGSLLDKLEHSDWIQSIVFSPDSAELASGANDKTVKLWDMGGPKAAAR